MKKPTGERKKREESTMWMMMVRWIGAVQVSQVVGVFLSLHSFSAPYVCVATAAE